MRYRLGEIRLAPVKRTPLPKIQPPDKIVERPEPPPSPPPIAPPPPPLRSDDVPKLPKEKS
jgi:hypothetical protein